MDDIDLDRVVNPESLTRAMKAGADVVLRGAQARAPRETGAMIASGTAYAVSPELAAIAFRVPWSHRREVSDGDRHPRGGAAHYLEASLKYELQAALDAMARELFGDDGL